MVFATPPRITRCCDSGKCAKHSFTTASVFESTTNAISGKRPPGDGDVFSIGAGICRTLSGSSKLITCAFGILLSTAAEPLVDLI